jgi:hypothetical protein
MSRCQCRAGFFALRDCDAAAVAECAVCRRLLCALHIAPGSEPTSCRDCWASQQQEAESETQEDYDDGWVYAYRSRHYGSALHARSEYDREDASSFVTEDGELEDDGDPQAGFGDS